MDEFVEEGQSGWEGGRKEGDVFWSDAGFDESGDGFESGAEFGPGVGVLKDASAGFREDGEVFGYRRPGYDGAF